MLRSRTGRRITEYRDALRIRALDALEWSRFAFNLLSGPTGVRPVYLFSWVSTARCTGSYSGMILTKTPSGSTAPPSR